MPQDTTQPARLHIDNLPRRQVGHDPDPWINQNAQLARNTADDIGITPQIEAALAEGSTLGEVQTKLGNKLNFVPRDERPAFLNDIRATLGILSRTTADGETQFQAWKTARGQPLATTLEQNQPTQPAEAEPRQTPANGETAHTANTAQPTSHMKLPDFHESEPLNRLKEQMGIPQDVFGTFPQPGQEPGAKREQEAREQVAASSATPNASIERRPGGEGDATRQTNISNYDHIQQLRTELTAAPPKERETIQKELDEALKHEPELAAAIASHDPSRQEAGGRKGVAKKPENQDEANAPGGNTQDLPEARRPLERDENNSPSRAQQEIRAFDPGPETNTPTNPNIKSSTSTPANPNSRNAASSQNPAISNGKSTSNNQNNAKTPEQKTNDEHTAAHVQLSGPGGALVDILAAVKRQKEPPKEPAPWDGPPANMEQRFADFDDDIQEDNEEALAGAETAAKTARDALKSYNAGPGGAILKRIKESAKQDPNGMEGVIGGMRAGGKYEDLRKEFDTALAKETGLSEAYNHAAGALKTYEGHREAISPILAAKNDPNLHKRFKELDAEIGKEGGKIPNKKEGLFALDELNEKTREVIKKAMEGLGNLFKIGARAEGHPSAGPSP